MRGRPVDAPAFAASRLGPGLRLSVLLHGGLALGVCGLALSQVPSTLSPAPEASIEVMFGANGAAGAAGAAMRGAGTGTTTRAASSAPGLMFRRGDPALVEAQADPGNRAPGYPADAQARGEAGLVTWRVVLDSDGRVDHLVLMHGSGHDDLDDAARAALLRWRYRPARRGGAPVASSVDVSVDFVLSPG